VSFTASGTAAVHLGLLGLHRGARQGGRIAHTAVEHSAVLHAARWTSPGAGDPIEIPVDQLGRVDVAPPGPDTSVIAVQTANHEVGTTQPVSALAAAAGDVPVFTDACASAGRAPLPEGWSAAAASAHKWGGPAGVGVLLVRKGARWRHPFPVDERIDERAPGFENVPAALAAAAALQAVVAERDDVGARQRLLVDRLRAAVSRIPDVDVVGDPVDRLPHLLTFSCLYADGESLVTELDRLGFGVASGSACTASTLTPSHVLAAMDALTHGNVRLSLTRDTTVAEVDAFLDALPALVERLRAEVGR
jgi:cysteine desulfurase